MGNIQSDADVDRLLTRRDGVTGTYDVIMTYAMSQFAAKHTVSQLAEKSHEKFMNNTLRIAMSFVTNLREGQFGLFQLNTGSTAEGLNLPQVFRVNEDGLVDTETADIDMLQIDNLFVETTFENAVKNNAQLYMDVSQTYPGFARVRAIDGIALSNDFLVKRQEEGKDVYYYTKYMIHQLRGTDSMSGPAVTKEVTINMETRSSNPTALSRNIPGETSTDMVYALNVTDWPEFMRDWKSRQTKTSSLANILEQKFGCFLVGAAHRHSKDPDIEWRISCSLPELILARELTVVQRQAYITFKYLVKETTKGQKGIMTYHLKTILFWTVEMSPPDVWREDNLAQCLYLLLDNFIHFLAKKRLPNYFITDSNLFEHLSNEHIRTTLCAMMKLRQEPLRNLCKFQRRLRLEGQSIFWDHALEVILLPHLLTASKILTDYQNYPKSSIVLLRQCLFNSVIDITSAKLSEAGLENVYAMMLTHLNLPVTLQSISLGLPFEDLVYNFLVHLFQRTFRSMGNTDVIFTFLNYVQQQSEMNGTMTDSLKKRLTLLEVCWNQLLASNVKDYKEADGHWDQCALVLDSLNLDQEDVITIAEYSCFFFQLWCARYRKDGDHSQIVETGKSIKVLQLIILTFHQKLSQPEYHFHEIWKLLSLENNHMEPNLTIFLESAISFHAPHEIIALSMNMLIIRKILVPSVESFLLLTKEECRCSREGISAEEVCDHAMRIKDLQKFVQVASAVLRKADELLYTIVTLLNVRIMHSDLHVPGDRRIAQAGVNFLHALVMMYANQWKGAFYVLMEISCPSLPVSQVISKYCYLCALVLVYAEYNEHPSRKAVMPINMHDNDFFCAIINHTVENDSDGALQRHFPRHMYNHDVDMSTYGKFKSSLEPINIKVTIPESTMEVEIHEKEITIHNDGKPTTYHYDKTTDFDDIINRHLGNSKGDLKNLSQREALDELSAGIKEIGEHKDEILEKMAARLGGLDSQSKK